MKTLLNLNAVQWIEIILIIQVGLTLGDVFAGHYRSGFKVYAQYIPFLIGLSLMISLLLAITSTRFLNILKIAGLLSILAGITGFGFHYYYGLVRKPHGSHWLLYYLMYGPPLLAPLSLSASGLFAFLISENAGIPAILICVVLSLVGLLLQTFPLHFRGAFNNLLMYIPFIAPVATILVIVVWLLISWPTLVLKFCLWASFLTGFIGLGMHLRGFDRQRGGLYVRSFNILEGPPAFAPGLYSTLSAIALVVIYLA